MSAPIINQPWEDVASDVTDAIKKAVQPLLKKAVDEVYTGLLETTQDYLKDNLAFNIASRIDAAEREAASDRIENEKLRAELRKARTTLSILRTQLMVQINRGHRQWDGVPEAIKIRLDAIDAVGGDL